MFRQIDKKNLNQQIVSQIMSRIVGGALRPGQKLPPERELAEQFSVNRNTLREALRQLELMGLLSIRQGDGIYIQNYRESGNLELIKHILYSSDDSAVRKTISDILEVRGIIIPEMAAKAALSISKKDLNEMKKTIKSTAKSTLEKDLFIHQIIAKSGGNIFYVILLNFFNQIFRDLGRLYFESEKNRSVSEQFHRDILKAFEESDPEKAEEIMDRVLEYAEMQILKQMGSKK